MDPRMVIAVEQVREVLEGVQPTFAPTEIRVSASENVIAIVEVREVLLHGESTTTIARIKFEDDDTWTLDVLGPDDTWENYLELDTHVPLEDILEELKEDPSNYFWG